MSERKWSQEEIVEALRQWEYDFYSDSETKWLMNKAADLIELLNNTIVEIHGVLQSYNDRPYQAV